jgi:hypothetical protein
MKANRDTGPFAERRLLCSVKNSSSRIEVTFQVSRPHVTVASEAASVADGSTCTCEVTVHGLDEPSVKYFGMDSVQALQLASDLDPLIKRLSAKYDFFWLTGEPYFEEAE